MLDKAQAVIYLKSEVITIQTFIINYTSFHIILKADVIIIEHFKMYEIIKFSFRMTLENSLTCNLLSFSYWFYMIFMLIFRNMGGWSWRLDKSGNCYLLRFIDVDVRSVDKSIGNLNNWIINEMNVFSIVCWQQMFVIDLAGILW